MYIVEQGVAGNSHYVRFSNGLVLQWGYSKTGETVTLPISYQSITSFALGASVYREKNSYAIVQTTEVTENSFVVQATWEGDYVSGDGCSWITIGI